MEVIADFNTKMLILLVLFLFENTLCYLRTIWICNAEQMFDKIIDKIQTKINKFDN